MGPNSVEGETSWYVQKNIDKVFNQMGQKYHFEDNFKSNFLNHIDKSIEKKHELTYIEESLIE